MQMNDFTFLNTEVNKTIFNGFIDLVQLNLSKEHPLNESENRSITYNIISHYIYTSKFTYYNYLNVKKDF